jgi:rhamnulokinase
VGALLETPNNSDAARAENFTNLIGADGMICFHKNVNGMWLMKQCQNAWAALGYEPSISELLRDAEREPVPHMLLDVDEPDLLRVGEMPQRINRQLVAKGSKPLDESPTNAPAFTALIMHSLARRYAETLTRIQQHTGKEIRRIFIVGGGSQNTFLNRLTAEATGFAVHRGSTESSTIGNFAVQLATLENEIPASSMEFAHAVRDWSLHLNPPA